MEAVIFDLDGVVTRTAEVHAEAWKQLFDEYLAARARRVGEPFEPFDRRSDYLRFVDGKPRFDGVASFLASRGIALPRGSPADPEERETVCGLGNRKNRYFLTALERSGAPTYPTTIALIARLHERGVRTAIVSSSRNCVAVLEAAGIRELFEVKVDGVDAAELGLPGKPDPAVFLEAARRLGVEPAHAAVVEDAISGVEAGRRGRFGLVIGVDRAAQREALAAAGADLVIARPCRGRCMSAWLLAYDGFDPATEGLREALCTLGNGFLATRGAAPEARADGVHYPATYAAGVYNRLPTTIAGQTLEDESIVNLPNWLPLTFRAEDGSWLEAAELLEHRVELDLRRGVLTRLTRARDDAGRVTQVTQRRIVSMDNPHLAGLETTIVPQNWSGRLEVRSLLDGTVVNSGVERYRALAGDHLTAVETTALDEDAVLLRTLTKTSRILVAEAARTRVERNGTEVDAERAPVQEPGVIGHELAVEVAADEPVTIEKVVTLFTSRDPAVSEPGHAAAREIARAPKFSELLDRHVLNWHELWRRFGISLEEGEERTHRTVNLHVFHLVQTLSRHTGGIDVGVPARGLHGEAYRGHIFWDELFVFPFVSLRLPRLARALLRYRYRRLREARWAAQDAGYAGAMFPWQSGSDGREETQRRHLNPRSGRWNADNSSLQRHINAAIAYNVWQYYQVTGDLGFIAGFGAELILESARFWSSIASYNRALDRYEIGGVMGPDEYHDAYPGASTAGLDNNAYTNVMAVWVFCRALDLLELLPSDRSDELRQRLSLTVGEVERWEDLSRKMRLVFHEDGILSQFEGYEQLEEFDWEGYGSRYGDISRLDRILESEGDTPNRYKVSKQADVLMLFYLFSAEELGEIFERLDYDFDEQTIPRAIDYYLDRTSHGSTLSRVVHAWVLARSDRSRSWEFFLEALDSDVSDIQGGTTAEGIHLGAMVGTLDLLQRCYAGLEIREDVLWLNPQLPTELRRLDFTILYRGQLVELQFEDGCVTVASQTSSGAPISIGIQGTVTELEAGGRLELSAPASLDS